MISKPNNDRFILNIGLKEISSERGIPMLKDKKGASVRRLNAEHAIVDIVDPELLVNVGDRLELWAHYSDATVNLHRQMFGLRNGQVEEVFVFES